MRKIDIFQMEPEFILGDLQNLYYYPIYVTQAPPE